METRIEAINNKMEEFLEEIPLTVHHQGSKIIVGVKRGFVKAADKKFGRSLVLELLDMLEDNPHLI